MTKYPKYKQIALKQATYLSLQSIGTKGETYDQIVRRLIELWVDHVAGNVGKLRK